HLISKEDMALFKVTTSVDQAVEEITRFYRVYHSSRTVGHQLVIRLVRPLPEKLVDRLSHDFADILLSGAIVQGPALAEEDEPEQSYGELAGRPYAALRDASDYDPERYWLWRPPGGETLVEVAARAGPALDRVAAGARGNDDVVVSHGGVMMALWWHVTGEWRMGRVARNAGLVVVEHEAVGYRGATFIEDV